MKDKVLDEIEIKNKQKKFSQLSFIFSIITLIAFGYLLASIPSKIKASEAIQQPNIIAITATQVFCVIGVIMMLLSFIRKEPSSWFKWAGGIINAILFLLMVGSIIFARIMDSIN